MEISQSEIDNAYVFKPVGRVDSRTAAEFEQTLLSAISEGQDKVIVDFTELNFMSSAGLRVVLMAAKRLNKKGFFALCGMSDNIREVFEVSGFSKILTITIDLSAALETLKAKEAGSD